MMPLLLKKSRPPLIVFTDLDGTLLDGRSYTIGPAQEMLTRLRAQRIPVVFCSSKTAAVQRPLRRELGLEQVPFIVENGAAVIVPDSAGLAVTDWSRVPGTSDERLRVLGRTFDAVRTGLARATAQTGRPVVGYADLTVRQIADLTGLDEEPTARARARQRDFSETLVDACSPATGSALEAALVTAGLTCRHGGRLRTVTGAESDKGRAARLVGRTVCRGTRADRRDGRHRQQRQRRRPPHLCRPSVFGRPW
jgi:mannosyl-3-phosphoglycerate phosphatase